MNEITRSSILAQIRELNETAESNGVSKIDEPKGGFSAALAESLQGVSTLQQDANAQAVAFQTGETDVNLVDVMLASQKASLSFHAAAEVRNKLVTAYQEIMNMPV